MLTHPPSTQIIASIVRPCQTFDTSDASARYSEGRAGYVPCREGIHIEVASESDCLA